MNEDNLLNQLFRAARAHPPEEAVPYAFQHRVMARIHALPLPDPSTFWAVQLWRAATPCFLVMLAVTLLTLLDPGFRNGTENLALDLERLILAPPNPWDESW
jgi:hypothetical protein